MTARPTSPAAEVDKLLSAGRRRHHRCRLLRCLADRHRQDHRRRRRPLLAGQHLARASTPTTDNGLYFRTAPSDVLQGQVLANLAGRGRLRERRHHGSSGLLRRGSGRAGRRRRSRTKGADVAEYVLYAADAQNFTAEVNKIAAAKPDALVADRLRGDQEDHPAADRQGHRPQDIQTLLRGRQPGRLLEGRRCGP